MKLTEPIVLIRLSFGMPSLTRQVASEGTAEKIGADKKRTKSNVKLFSGEAFSRITRAQSIAKSAVLKYAIQIPLDFDGVYIAPRAALDRIESELKSALDIRVSLVDSFLRDDYASERREAERALGTAFDPNDYPPSSILRDQFTMRWRYFTLDVPEELPKEIRDRETSKLQAEISQIGSECRAALREGLAKLVSHLVERLTPDADGKPKRLFETTVTNLREFLDTISLRDITGDTDVRKLAEQAKKVLGDVNVDTLKESKSTATKIRAGLDQIGKQVAALVRTDGARKFDFAEEPVAEDAESVV